MGERLICRARVIKPGRQVAVVAADVFCVTDGIEKRTATAVASIAMLEKAPGQKFQARLEKPGLSGFTLR
jgi:acyl-coenzyme A thioesterase PaaI-like protein